MAEEPTEVHLNPMKVFTELEELLPSNAVLVADGGDFVATAAYILRWLTPLTPRLTFFHLSWLVLKLILSQREKWEFFIWLTDREAPWHGLILERLVPWVWVEGLLWVPSCAGQIQRQVELKILFSCNLLELTEVVIICIFALATAYLTFSLFFSTSFHN